MPPHEILADELAQAFIDRLDDLPAYERSVVVQCRGFPEGDLFPYTFPLQAFARRRQAGRQPDIDATVAAGLVAAAERSARRIVRPPQQKWGLLDSFPDQATYLGHVLLAMQAFRQVWHDERYERTERHLTNLLVERLRETDGQPLPSFPNLRWPFDTVPCLLVLQRSDDPVIRKSAPAIIARHLAVQAEQARSTRWGLPPSQLHSRRATVLAPPRGCDLSWRIALVAELDRELALNWWAAYKRHYYTSQPPLVGFREWPPGEDRPADPDSGPIYAGIGLAATALALGAARVLEDQPVRDGLAAQLSLFQSSRRLLAGTPMLQQVEAQLGALAPPAEDTVTGFLFGDCCLFLMVQD